MHNAIFMTDVTGLAAKLGAAKGHLKNLIADYDDLLGDLQARGMLGILPAVLEGREEAEHRQKVLDYARRLARLDGNDAVQYHTWCMAGAAMRYAVYFDWLTLRGAWTEADTQSFAQAMLGFGFKHAYMTSQSRCRASNNQNLSMALYCAVVGYLFGHKLADHATGKFLYEFGMSRLPDLIGLFPGDGYGGEGSTYTSHVNTPLACWTLLFLNQVTGENWADKPFMPNGNTLGKMIEMEHRLLSPGGNLLPWDHYGWQKQINSSPFALLARIKGDPRYLTVLAKLTQTRNPGMLAWGNDDPLWSLLWWPEEYAKYDEQELDEALFGWCLPRTGACLDDVKHKSRLAMVWDMTAGSAAGIGRAQCDPNHVMLEVAGEPVFQDGSPKGDVAAWAYSAEEVFARFDQEQLRRLINYRGSMGTREDEDKAKQNWIKAIAQGTVGAANAVVVDEQPWMWPDHTVTGRCEIYHRGPDLQVVRTDCTQHYAGHFDVTRMARTCVWHGQGYGLIVDDLRADSAHHWQWQVHMRPQVVRSGEKQVTIKLATQQMVTLAWEAAAQVRLTEIENYPNSYEQKSVRLELINQGSTARFVVAVVRGEHEVSVRALSDTHYQVCVDGGVQPLDITHAIQQGAMPIAAADAHDLSDQETDGDWQYEILQRACAWKTSQAEVVEQADSCVMQQIDECLSQIKAAKVDESKLRAGLVSEDWAVKLAAIEAVTRLGWKAVMGELREMLIREHGVSREQLYPPLDHESIDASRGAAGTAAVQLAKQAQVSDPATRRWRIKAALIRALGVMKDEAAVAVLADILRDNIDFYPVSSLAAQALGRIGGQAARSALQPALKDSEHNTMVRARYAAEALMR